MRECMQIERRSLAKPIYFCIYDRCSANATSDAPYRHLIAVKKFPMPKPIANYWGLRQSIFNALEFYEFVEDLCGPQTAAKHPTHFLYGRKTTQFFSMCTRCQKHTKTNSLTLNFPFTRSI